MIYNITDKLREMTHRLDDQKRNTVSAHDEQSNRIRTLERYLREGKDKIAGLEEIILISKRSEDDLKVELEQVQK